MSFYVFKTFIIINPNMEIKASFISYSVFLYFQDGGGRCFYNETNYWSNVAFSFITIVDVPDLNPMFLGLPYVASVEENSPVVSAEVYFFAVQWV